MIVKFLGNSLIADERFNTIISDLIPFSYCRIDLCVYYSWYECPRNSFAIYKADELGVIDLNTVKPVKGNYKFADSMGLFYGLKNKKGKYKKRNKRDFTKEFITCNYVFTSGDIIYKDTLIRHFTTNDILCKHIYNEFRGEYYYHKNLNHNKCVILLGGSEGIINPLLPMASCLANKGFNVMALQYFNPYPDSDEEFINLPRKLECIPLEYINSCIDWLMLQSSQNEIFIMGSSKGAELALLVASYNRYIKKVVAISPSAFINQGCSSFTSSWSFRGEPLTYIKYFPFINAIDLLKNILFSILKIPQGYFLTYEISKIFSLNKNNKRIKVENICGDIMLIAGKMDTMWNSAYSLMLLKSILEDKKTSYKHRYLLYNQAGHCFYTPFLFSTDNFYGGNKVSNFYANEDSWRNIIDFLNQPT